MKQYYLRVKKFHNMYVHQVHGVVYVSFVNSQEHTDFIVDEDKAQVWLETIQSMTGEELELVPKIRPCHLDVQL